MPDGSSASSPPGVGGTGPDLAVLLDRCRHGDDLAWEALVRRFQARVYGLAWQYVRDVDEARDLAQEAFIRIYRKLSTFHGHETFVPWMLRLTRNLCVDRLRRRKARPPASDVAVEDGPEIPDTAPGPAQSARASAEKNLVHRALARVTEANREMIVLKDIHGLNLQEIAALLGIPLGTVKSRSNRARLELARVIVTLDPSYGEVS